MRIVLLIGNEANQKALACKIHAKYPLAGIVTETRKVKRKYTLRKIIEGLVERAFLPVISSAWFGMKDYYEEKFPDFPKDIPLLNVANVNGDECIAFVQSLNAELIVVSGTRMIRKKTLEAITPHIGITNLHTGLSPYIKGGPNCTNWCIATEQYHLIGNTIMWIDAGIDTGNLITTEHTSFNGKESLLDIHIKVMEHAHDLYLRGIDSIAARNPQNIPQKEIAEGITYYSKQWNLEMKFRLSHNLKKFRKIVNTDSYLSKKNSIDTVKTR